MIFHGQSYKLSVSTVLTAIVVLLITCLVKGKLASIFECKVSPGILVISVK